MDNLLEELKYVEKINKRARQLHYDGVETDQNLIKTEAKISKIEDELDTQKKSLDDAKMERGSCWCCNWLDICQQIHTKSNIRKAKVELKDANRALREAQGADADAVRAEYDAMQGYFSRVERWKEIDARMQSLGITHAGSFKNKNIHNFT